MYQSYAGISLISAIPDSGNAGATVKVSSIPVFYSMFGERPNL
jgi:hypothetical protein